MTRVGAVKDLVLAVLGQYDTNSWHPSLGNAVKGLSAGQAKWRPASDQHCIWEHINHIIAWDEELASRLAGNPPRKELYEKVEPGWPGPAGEGRDPDWQETVARLARAHAGLVEAATGGDDDEALTRTNGNAKASAATRLIGCAGHESYHLSQVVLLRRMQGAWNPEW